MTNKQRSGGLLSSGMLPIVQMILLVLVTIHTWPASTPGPGPGPSPSPAPGPTPSPVIDSENAWVVMVERADKSAELRSDHTYWSSLEGRKLRYRWYLENSNDPGAQPLIATAKSVGLPALVFVTAAGKVVRTIPAPSDGEEADRITKEVYGR